MADQKEKQEIQLAPGALTLFEYVSLRHDAVIPKNVKPEEMLNPAFWAHHGLVLRPMHEIRARSEDGSWVAELLVLDCSRNWVKVKILSIDHLTTSDVSLTQASQDELRKFMEAHAIIHRGPRKWSVKRLSDSAILVEDLEEKGAAEAWLKSHATGQVRPQTVPAPVAA